jgi:hypothetical protein
MKVAVAFAGLMASSVFAADGGLTRLHFFYPNNCTADVGGNETYPVTPTGLNAGNGWTKVNIDAMEYKDGGDADGYVVVHAFHYFPGTAGDNIVNPSDYSTDAFLTASRDDDFSTALAVTPELGRELIFRIDYGSSEEGSCTAEKNEDGDFEFNLDTKWNMCADNTCAAAMAIGSGGQLEYSIFSRSETGTGDTNTRTRLSDNAFPLTVDFAYTSKGGAADFLLGFDANADAVDGAHSCFGYDNSYTADQLGLPEGSTGRLYQNDLALASSGGSNIHSLINANVVPDEKTDLLAEASNFKFQSVAKKMCGDSSRVAQVAAFSVASVAAGLLSFF